MGCEGAGGVQSFTRSARGLTEASPCHVDERIACVPFPRGRRGRHFAGLRPLGLVPGSFSLKGVLLKGVLYTPDFSSHGRFRPRSEGLLELVPKGSANICLRRAGPSGLSGWPRAMPEATPRRQAQHEG